MLSKCYQVEIPVILATECQKIVRTDPARAVMSGEVRLQAGDVVERDAEVVRADSRRRLRQRPRSRRKNM